MHALALVMGAQGIYALTPEVGAHARPCERGTRLAQGKIAQFEGYRAAALRNVERYLGSVKDLSHISQATAPWVEVCSA